MRYRFWFLATTTLASVGLRTIDAQTKVPAMNDTAGIQAFYGDWGAAVAARGSEGYASFFLEDAVVLPPGESAVAGREAIRKWMQAKMDQYTTQTTRFQRDEIRIGNGWAFMRVTISISRKPKSGGEAVDFKNKYLDVIQKAERRKVEVRVPYVEQRGVTGTFSLQWKPTTKRVTVARVSAWTTFVEIFTTRSRRFELWRSRQSHSDGSCFR